MLEILSDKPLWFTVTEGNAEPACIVGLHGEGNENTLTHQYFAYSTVAIDSSISEGDTVDLPVGFMHVQSDEATLEEALSIADGSLINERGGRRKSVWIFQSLL